MLHQDLAEFEGNCAYEGQDCSYLDLPRLAAEWGLELTRVPFSLRVLLENIVRNQPTQLTQSREIFVRGYSNAVPMQKFFINLCGS